METVKKVAKQFQLVSADPSVAPKHFGGITLHSTAAGLSSFSVEDFFAPFPLLSVSGHYQRLEARAKADKSVVARVAYKRACRTCGQECGGALGLPKSKRCSACHITIYCSKECQAADWGRHKPECQQWRVEPTDAKESIEFEYIAYSM